MPKILIADDDKVILGLLKTLMELEGNEVIAVTRAEDIVPAAKDNPLALILIDYHLAGGNSMSALRELKANPALKQIPVLVASGMDREYECRQNGADGFILKPFRPTDLLNRIKALIEQSQQAA